VTSQGLLQLPQGLLQLPGWPTALVYDLDDHGIVTRCPAKARMFSSRKCSCLSWGPSIILWNVWSGCMPVDEATGGVVLDTLPPPPHIRYAYCWLLIVLHRNIRHKDNTRQNMFFCVMAIVFVFVSASTGNRRRAGVQLEHE